MKALAAVILSQRSEIEEFFIEALNEVSESAPQHRAGQRMCVGERYGIRCPLLILSLQSVL